MQEKRYTITKSLSNYAVLKLHDICVKSGHVQDVIALKEAADEAVIDSAATYAKLKSLTSYMLCAIKDNLDVDHLVKDGFTYTDLWDSLAYIKRESLVTDDDEGKYELTTAGLEWLDSYEATK